MTTARVACAPFLFLALAACAGARLGEGGGAPASRSGSASDAIAFDVAYPRRSWHPSPPSPCVPCAPPCAPPCPPPCAPPCPPPCPPAWSAPIPPPCGDPVPCPCRGFEVAVRARAWWASPSGDLLITRGGEPGSGTTADLENDFGLDTSVVPSVGVDVRYRRHRIRLDWERLSFDGDATLDSGVVFRGTAYPAGEHVNGSMCLTLYEAGYQFLLVDAPCTDVWVGASAWVWDFCASLDGDSPTPGLSETRSFSHVLPVATLDAEQRFGRFSLKGGVHGGLLASDRYAIDLQASAGWRIVGPLEIEAGWRWMRFAFHETTNEMVATFDGPFVGLSATFDL